MFALILKVYGGDSVGESQCVCYPPLRYSPSVAVLASVTHRVQPSPIAVQTTARMEIKSPLTKPLYTYVAA